MFAGVRALVLAHHGEGFFGNRAHRLDVLLQLEVEHRTDVQASLGRVGIHRAARAMFGEDADESLGIVGEVRQRHRAVLDERDRLAGLAHRHHDVQAGGAELGDAGLQGRLRDFDNAAPFRRRPVPAEAEIAHQFTELP